MRMEEASLLRDAFDEAIELEGEAREKWLARSRARDPELTSRLEAMLSADTSDVDRELAALPRRLMGGGGVAGSMVGEGSDADVRVGPFRLLGVIGEGGFGVVHLAEQSEPIRRLVAIKLIKPGMDSRAIIARFNDERQALALMDHPAVATAIDAGTTRDGRPYVVMPLIAGVPITHFCTAQRTTIRDRVALMVAVCEGVQHAHSRGVIHRDLKPGNILVTEREGAAEPKIIDFGLAKALASPLTSHETLTLGEHWIGTPEYMAPEQAAGVPVDTRADIYSLGVVLYELLAGRPPIARAELAGKDRAGVLEVMERGVRAPSKAAGGASGASGIDRELDWITLHCLEREPSRRYATADALAADLRRYLEARPVEVGPPARAYRMWRWVSRHRLPVAAGAVATLGVLLGSGAAVGFAITAKAEERRALQALGILRSVVTGVDPMVAQGLDPTLTLKQLEQVEGMLEDPTLDAKNELFLSEALAIAYASIGRGQEAYTLGRRALKLLDDLEPGPSIRRMGLLDLLVRTGLDLNLEIRERDGIKAMSREALALSELLLPADSEAWFRAEELDRRTYPGRFENYGAFFERAVRVLGPSHRQTLTIMRRQAEQMQANGAPGAVEMIESARALASANHGESSPLTHIELPGELLVHLRAGASNEALLAMVDERLPRAQEILGRFHPTVIRTRFNQASVLMRMGQYPEATRVLEDARSVEVRARGPSSAMANWFAAMLATAHLRMDDWGGYLREEANLTSETKRANLSLQMRLELCELTALRGEKERARGWLTTVDGKKFPEAESLRRKYNLE
jgi:eukaryotic-like serine/threonine-protein kinase